MRTAAQMKASLYEGDAVEVLRAVLRDTLSPHAVAAIANAARVQANTLHGRNAEGDAHRTAVARELEWFADVLNRLVGQKSAKRLLNELGL